MWNLNKYEKLRLAVMEKLDKNAFPSNEDRAKFALDRVQQLSSSAEPTEQMECFINVMVSFSMHLDLKHLKPKQISNLMEIGTAILKINGVQKKSSHSSVLYGQLCMAKSQIHFVERDYWKALIFQQRAIQVSPKITPFGESYQEFLFGIKAYRLGYIGMALNHFETASSDEEFVYRNHALLYEIKCKRLSAYRLPMDMLGKGILQEPYWNDSDRLELQWELLRKDIDQGQNFQEMLSLVFKTSCSVPESYKLEAMLITFSHPKSAFINLIPKTKIQLRSQSDDPELKMMRKFLKTLSLCYDKSIDFSVRLGKITEVSDLPTSFSIPDFTLLAPLALCRWFLRHNNFTLAKFYFAEYSSLSLKMSMGSSYDVSKLASDIVDRPWCKGLIQDKARKTTSSEREFS
ncbi:hypothetical protein [Pseudobacteriovorax antillogorgiicola]|uniref:Uncharacterized protein n=1 Tax=Pseudobacteriovorax antillogorgiicola TaxID=1513793 RepID=A0A1Y6CPY2_9BACT|nr:hypothetical protein [Pseudobacteriovorax antillogorgiicola]TCS42716.1 hypothetical protein EDD56_1413 [Pseudobacteriovorax antillogorgiicola]SMF82459.1 hypothetical protein SAMN06296036_14116 [Pseudobacteriovorax antillogorgiicola]